MRFKRVVTDPMLFWLCVAVSLLGLVAIWNAGYARSSAAGSVLPRELVNQTLYLVIAVFVGWLCTFVPRDKWNTLAWVGLLLSFLALIAVHLPVIGHTQNGATRWIKLGPFTLQPAEFVKLAAVMFLAATMAGHTPWKDPKKHFKNFGERIDRVWIPKLKRGFPFLLVLILAIVVERQPDLATGAVIVASGVAIIVVAGVTRKSLILLALGSTLLATAAVIDEPYRLERFKAHWTRWDDANRLDKGYQTVISETALARGGIFGVGLGNGEAKTRLPAPTTDFVLTTVGEEFGLVGVLSIVGLLGAVVWRLFWLGARSQDVFGRLVFVGLGTWIGIQACTNVVMVNGSLPPIGIPLPFVSYGGSSLLALWMAIGISMTMVAKNTRKEVAEPETDSYGWRNRRARISRT